VYGFDYQQWRGLIGLVLLGWRSKKDGPGD